MATFLLVSGAWHAAWCWERVAPLLEAAGHRVITPDLVGMAVDDETDLGTVTLATWADQVAGVIAAQAEPVILVGHSRGGIVISEAAERVAGKIRTLVYLAAFLLQEGETVFGALASTRRDASDILLRSNDTLSSAIRSEAVGPVFYNLTDPQWVERAISQVRPEPVAAMATPLKLSEVNFGSVPRVYIECLQDGAVPIELQRQMQAGWPCDQVFTLDSDHSPFFSAPKELSEVLMSLA